jgi:hypothetical protein
MIPQHTPLFAVDTREGGRPFIVVGWRESATTVQRMPYLAPMVEPGPVLPADAATTAALRYSVTDPRPPRPRPAIVPAGTPPRGGMDQTEVLPNFPPTPRLRP